MHALGHNYNAFLKVAHFPEAVGEVESYSGSDQVNASRAVQALESVQIKFQLFVGGHIEIGESSVSRTLY